MFEKIQGAFSQLFDRVRGVARFTPSLLERLLGEFKENLLEADVAFEVVEAAATRLSHSLLQVECPKHLTTEQYFIQQVHKVLTDLMRLGEADGTSELLPPPDRLLLVGLQGSGKTTTAAKLAWRWKKEGKRILLASTDFYRPAAREQLESLANQYELHYFPGVLPPQGGDPDDLALAVAVQAKEAWRKGGYDGLLVDTAGRLHCDLALMSSLMKLQEVIQPDDTWLVADGMLGQDAAKLCQVFKERVQLSGAILTKMDGDARGGAALSVVGIAKVPIQYMGVGEKAEALEAFHADRVASRIMGMGDLLGLIDSLDRSVQEEMAQKMAKPEAVDLEDFRQQLLQTQKLGGVSAILDRLPFAFKGSEAIRAEAEKVNLSRMLAILDSMTPKERRRPFALRSSQKRRIALGSGTSPREVNELLKKFEMQKAMMKQFSSSGSSGGLLKGFKDLLTGKAAAI